MVSKLSLRATMAVALPWPWLALGQPALEEVHVTGVPQDQSPNELAQSISVLSGQTLDRVERSTLGETLSGQLGISSSNFGAGASRPIIRGLGGPRVLTLEDGIDSLDVSTVSADHAVSVDPLVADQIEVFRGPTTLLYGSGAVGGVVNTVTNRIPELAPEDALTGAVELSGDTAADARGGALRLDGGADRFAWHADAQHRSADDYAIPVPAERDAAVEHAAGTLENSRFDVQSAAAGVSWLGPDSFVGVSLSRFESEYGVPGHHAHDEEAEPEGEAHEDEAHEDVRIDLDRTRVDVEGGWLGLDGAIQTVNLRIGVNDYAHVELEGGAPATRFDNDAYEVRVEALHAPLGRWTGAFGVQLTSRDFAAIGEEAFVPPVETEARGLFLIERLELADWRVSLGGRLESQSQRPSGGAAEAEAEADGTAASVSAAAIRDLGGGLALAFNAARAERLPAAEELYANGPHLATGTVELGDPALGAETAHHLDIGLRRSLDSRNWSVTGFFTSFSDFIYLRDTGTVDAEHALPVFAFAQRDADLWGLEAEYFTPIASTERGELDLRLHADFVRGELDGGTDLPRMPPVSYGARLQYHDERRVVGLEFTRYRSQTDIAPFETPTAGYTMVNVDLSWRLVTGEGVGLELSVRGSNLNDEEARKHTSLVKDVAPLPGRNVTVGLRTRF